MALGADSSTEESATRFHWLLFFIGRKRNIIKITTIVRKFDKEDTAAVLFGWKIQGKTSDFDIIIAAVSYLALSG